MMPFNPKHYFDAIFKRFTVSFSSAERPYRPNLSTTDFLATVSEKYSVGTPKTISGPPICGQIKMVARHFRNRKQPVFFATALHLSEAAAGPDREGLGSIEQTLLWLNSAVDRHFGIYAVQIPPLSQGIDWLNIAPGPGNDDLFPARPHRFAFAPKLALAELYGGRHEGLLANIVRSWQVFAQSGKSNLPYLSNLSVTQRFIALSWVWAFLAARPESVVSDKFALEFEILKILWADAQFLIPRLGGSYPNNHLLADGFIGWYIYTLFPEFVPNPNQGKEWERLWLRELRRQIYEDGTSLEHSTHYHEFACEMAVAYILLSGLNGCKPPDWMIQRTKRMLEFQIALGGPTGSPVHIGDATDDPLFPLEPDESWATGAMREFYRALYEPNLTPNPPTASGVASAFWLLGGNIESPPKHKDAQPSSTLFKDGGYYVLWDEVLNGQLVFRSGPSIGVPVLEGHMHADFMSVYLSLGDAPLIVDSGTYTYKNRVNWPLGSPDWRSYFMGPRSHNGLSVGDTDPLGPVSGNFRNMDISARVKTTPLVNDNIASRIEGEMLGADAYNGWRRGVVHIPGHYWVVYDTVTDSQIMSDASFGFQFAADISLETVPEAGTTATSGKKTILIAHSHGLNDPKISFGDLDPIAGWISNTYGSRQPAQQVRYACRPSTRSFTTTSAFLLRILESQKQSGHIETIEGDDYAFRITTENAIDYLLLPPIEGAKKMKAWGIEFVGMLMWLRTVDAKPKALRCLNVASLSAGEYGLDITTQEPVEAIDVSFGPDEVEVRYCSSRIPNIKFG